MYAKVLSKNYTHNNTGFTATVKFNATTFLPESLSNGNISDNYIDYDNNRILEIDCDNSTEQILTEIKGTVLLGDTLTDLEIVDFAWKDTLIDADYFDGSLRTKACALKLRGIEYLEPLEVKLWPNPVRDVLNIECNKEYFFINIYQNTGKSIKHGFDLKTINVSNYTNGLYFIIVKKDNCLIYKSININH